MVTSYDRALTCGDLNTTNVCSATYPVGARFAVDAVAAPGYQLVGFAGACTGRGPCVITIGSGDQQVSATFKAVGTYIATIVPSTQGTIQALTASAQCPGTCSYTGSMDGQNQTFSVMPATGYVFASWGGACAGQGVPCRVPASGDFTVSANYTWVGTVTLTVSRSFTGTIQNQDKSLACGFNASDTLCQVQVTKGVRQMIYAFPAPGMSTFLGFTGDCSGTVSPCLLDTSTNRTVAGTYK